MRWSPLLLLVLHHLSATRAQCGVPAGLTKIVGGQSVPSLRYPWYVALVSPTHSTTVSVSCGGSLITNRHVLTAAHCFPSEDGVSPEKMYRVVFELVDRCTNPNVPDSSIARVDINPLYNSQTLGGDVAVVTLERSVPYMPVCLPPRNAVRTGEATIIGFGSTLVKSAYPCTMQEARVNIFSRRECARSGLSPEYSRIPGTICAGLPRGGVDSCDGDSGGPIQTVDFGGVYTIQGIVSFGEGCARKNLPGVYTQVSAYRDFIDRAVSEPEPEPEPGDCGGDGVGVGVHNSTREEEPPRHPSFLQGLLSLLIHLHPLRPLTAPDSSSGVGGVLAGGGAGSPDVAGAPRPLSPLQAFLQSLGFPNLQSQPSTNQLYTSRNPHRNQFNSGSNQFSQYRFPFYPRRNEFSANSNQFYSRALSQA